MSNDVPAIEAVIEALRRFDTPTVCNALDEAYGTRYGGGFTRETLVCPFPNLPPMVGFARTAQILGTRPTALDAKSYLDFRLGYYAHMGGGSGSRIAVIEDLDDAPVAAYWGELNAKIHKTLGLKGALTNGCVRDLDALQPDFPILAGKVTPAHAFVHVEAIDVPVRVFGLEVRPNDLVHADRHGAVVVPLDHLHDLPRHIETVIRRERVILDACDAAGFNIETLKEAIRTSVALH